MRGLKKRMRTRRKAFLKKIITTRILSTPVPMCFYYSEDSISEGTIVQTDSALFPRMGGFKLEDKTF